ncbi:MAG TPA: cation transporter [Casimicrobiaceae bacterium]|jgi:solute carrier family 30 (zinc transporter), member 9|nr:cation transporter [Casimicrobiaceae bacterium]
MSSSIRLSIATNTAIFVSKGFGWLVTGSPTLFAESIHSLADVGNQVLLHIGEVRSEGEPDREHPFGTGQERYFWALVSAVSVFFIGCGINVYHGIDALLHPTETEPFSALVLGLLVLALLLESWTFATALRELGGWRGLRGNLNNTPVLAVLLEDTVALVGILLTLLVGGVSYFLGPHPAFDAVVAVLVGVLLGVMAAFLAALNRRLLIDTTDQRLDRAAEQWLGERGIDAEVRSLVLGGDRYLMFVRANGEVEHSLAVGDELKAHLAGTLARSPEAVYWKFKRALG